MSWDEWEQIKLNQLPADSGPAVSAVTGGLKSSQRAWLAAGDGVGALRGRVRTALGKLEDGQSGLGDPDGCLSAAAQKELYASWKTYAENVGKRCASLQKTLERVGHEQLMTDAGVQAEIDRVRLAYADTDAVGGGPQQGR
ncbi:hypothetical protein [Streptomyces katsurahamanus]|uniref:Uncharacterized protein n=1 Tax=Streptomyces katsurahamanus TaxID=2577098 RepID=A0ABW9P1R0_9ACTN|nr:hypothetical protein [Streptomyces katsurahamanus]MQS39311.1 hypothetical protein [Streptomyces katsurahamanus]